ncbi:MAG: phosphoenolpyruvate synthase [Caldilineaceae bacterium]
MSEPVSNQSNQPKRATVLPFTHSGAAHLAVVGGKGANLSALTVAGFPVPPGFCITTAAFECFLAAQSESEQLYALLAALNQADSERARQLGAHVRNHLQQTPLPAAVAHEIVQAWQTLGAEQGYAVRSSATAEDLPDASFAGQHDTFLNVRGETALLASVYKCWVSLFTDRAILYRAQQGIDQRKVRIAVVVQRMVEPQVSGIIFTADPVTGHRNRSVIDASFGLGEALVAGLVTADHYQVDKATQQIVKRQIADKQRQVLPLPAGGVATAELPPEQSTQPALNDPQVLALATLGAQIEAHYGAPQDIEWALADGAFFVLQARPITTLYPLPQPAPTDGALHVYFSFGHFQVMTDPLPDLVISLWRTLIHVGRSAREVESPYLRAAGGRIYIDLSLLLRHPLLGRVIPGIFASIDPLAAQMLATVAQCAPFQRQGKAITTLALLRFEFPLLRKALGLLIWRAPEGTSEWGLKLMERNLAQAEAQLSAAPTPLARLKVAIQLLLALIPTIFRDWFPYFLAGELAYGLLQRLLHAVADPNDLVAVGRGLQGNVVTEMNLALDALAELVHQSPLLLRHLSQIDLPIQTRLHTTATVPGGAAFWANWKQFISHYGMRAPAEIDLSRPRWHENPSSLLQMVLNQAQHGEPGAQRAQFEQLTAASEAASVRLVQAAQRGAWGWLRALLTRRLVRVVRQLLPTREHHKFWMIRLLGLIKPVLLEAGEQLVGAGRIERADDVWFLTLPELLTALGGSSEPLQAQIAQRHAALARHRTLSPPRVMTSEGEIPVVTAMSTGAPPGALIGTPVSGGVVEGPARIVRDPQTATVKQGEILVAPFTDPGWTPLFLNAAGLVTEVGGVMTHGSVVAREYGIPAVVGVVEATERIRTGQRLRVDGDQGWVILLEDESSVR